MAKRRATRATLKDAHRGPRGIRGATGRPGPPGEAGPAGHRGSVGPRGPSVTATDVLAAVHDEFAAIRKEFDVQLTRMAQLQQQLDTALRRIESLEKTESSASAVNVGRRKRSG